MEYGIVGRESRGFWEEVREYTGTPVDLFTCVLFYLYIFPV
jgi:hypothetical protein